MAAITSAQTGLWSATTTWVGGVVPGEFDTVTIAAGHTVTVDGTRIVGNDSTPGLTINGRLRASRTVNSLLTIKGTVANATTGEWDWGVEGDIIPPSVTAGVRVNYSSAMANNKYIVGLGTTNRMNLIGMRGANKTRHTKTLTAVTGGSTTTFTVVDASGWAVGDWVIVSAEVNGVSTTVEGQQISSISGNNITVATAWANSRAAGAVVANVWSNVYIEHHNTGNYSGFSITPRTGMPANSIDVKNVSLHGLGTDGTLGAQSALTVLSAPYFASSTAVFRDGVIARVAVTNIRRDGSLQTAVGGAGVGIGVANSAVEFEFSECVVAYRGVALASQLALRAASNSAGVGFRSCCVMNVPTGYISNFSDGGSGIVLTDFVTRNVTTPVIVQPGTALVVAGGDFDRYSRFTILGTGDITVNGANLGVNNAGAVTNSVGGLALVRCALTNCTVGSMALSTSIFVTAPANPLAEFSFVNKNSDVTVQEIQSARGFLARDSAVTKRSTSSIRFQPQRGAGISHGRTYSLSGASAGQTVTVRGSLRFDSTYGTTTPPSVTLSGQGSTPATFTAGGTANTWHDFSLTVTPSSTGDLTLTVTGTTTATTGNYYLDGVILPPFVVAARHYGFLHNNAVFQTVDPVITVSNEATVAAYTGIAVNHATDTITVTVSRTIAQLYDYLRYDLGLTANLGEADYLGGTLSALSIGGYNLVIDGCTLTSGGTLTTTGTITLANGGAFAGTRVDSSGSISSAIATVTGLVAGSRVQIYNVTASAESANEVVASTSWALNYYNGSQFTAGDQIRIRVARLGYLPQTLLAVATTTGFSVPASQQTDAVYLANAIDGSAVSEFTADYPNVQMDVSDPDGVTTVQRVYAWLRHTETSAQGINLWFDAVTPTDAVNYLIDVAKLNLKIDNTSASPVVIAGGRIYRSDGATVIASTSGSIQMDPSRVYMTESGASVVAAAVLAAAEASPIHADARRVNGYGLRGAGVVGDEWGPA